LQARHPGPLRIAEGGKPATGSISRAVSQSLNFRQAEATSVPITLILLLVVFGALMAAGIPVLLAVSAVMAALGLVTISSHWLPVGNRDLRGRADRRGWAVGVGLLTVLPAPREREGTRRGRRPFPEGAGGSPPAPPAARSLVSGGGP